MSNIKPKVFLNWRIRTELANAMRAPFRKRIEEFEKQIPFCFAAEDLRENFIPARDRELAAQIDPRMLRYTDNVRVTFTKSNPAGYMRKFTPAISAPDSWNSHTEPLFIPEGFPGLEQAEELLTRQMIYKAKLVILDASVRTLLKSYRLLNGLLTEWPTCLQLLEQDFSAYDMTPGTCTNQLTPETRGLLTEAMMLIELDKSHAANPQQQA